MQNLGVVKKKKVAQEGIPSLFIVFGGVRARILWRIAPTNSINNKTIIRSSEPHDDLDGHLGEQLLDVVNERLVGGKEGQGRVVIHRAQCLLPGFEHDPISIWVVSMMYLNIGILL